MNRSADYGTIIRVIKERGTNYQPDSLIAEFVECAIYDNTDLSFYQTMWLVVMVQNISNKLM